MSLERVPHSIFPIPVSPHFTFCNHHDFRLHASLSQNCSCSNTLQLAFIYNPLDGQEEEKWQT